MPPEAVEEWGRSSLSLGRNQAWWPCELGLQPPELRDKAFLWIKLPGLWSHYSSHSKRTHQAAQSFRWAGTPCLPLQRMAKGLVTD